MTLQELFFNCQSAKYIDVPSTKGSYCIERYSDELFIYFQGSNCKKDWLHNFSFPAKAYHEMKDKWYVHRGFLKVFKSIKPYLVNDIMNKKYQKITIVGYSHGAALAVLCHEWCIFNRPDIASNINGYGFGCPRVLWGKANERVLARFDRFTVVRNSRDIVTHLPPKLFGFKHVGVLREVGKGDSYGPIKSHKPECYQFELGELRRRSNV